MVMSPNDPEGASYASAVRHDPPAVSENAPDRPSTRPATLFCCPAEPKRYDAEPPKPSSVGTLVMMLITPPIASEP